MKSAVDFSLWNAIFYTLKLSKCRLGLGSAFLVCIVYGIYCLKDVIVPMQSHANRYKRHIVPVLSVSIDFYVRVFVRIYL